MPEFLPPGQRPRCAMCDKDLRPYTEWETFGHYGDKNPKPKTLEEAQRRVNRKIVSVGRDNDKMIWKVTVWDGVTYECAARGRTQEPLFCTNRCAIRFAEASYR